jgi:hypothetical protein
MPVECSPHAEPPCTHDSAHLGSNETHCTCKHTYIHTRLRLSSQSTELSSSSMWQAASMTNARATSTRPPPPRKDLCSQQNTRQHQQAPTTHCCLTEQAATATIGSNSERQAAHSHSLGRQPIDPVTEPLTGRLDPLAAPAAEPLLCCAGLGHGGVPPCCTGTGANTSPWQARPEQMLALPFQLPACCMHLGRHQAWTALGSCQALLSHAAGRHIQYCHHADAPLPRSRPFSLLDALP